MILKVPLVMQFSETECGVASLAMLFAYYGCATSMEILREKCGASRDGCKALTLIEVASQFGFTADAYKIELEDIKHLTEPVIAFWNFSHYVVIKGIGRGKIFINDPALGERAVSLEEFDRSFTGVVILLTPIKKFAGTKSASEFLSYLKEWFSAIRSDLIFILICLCIITGVPLVGSALSSVFVDYCVIRKNINWIPAIALATLSFAGILMSSVITQKWNQFKICTRSSIVKSSEIISHALQLPAIFYSLRQKGEIISILMRVELIVDLIFRNAVLSGISILTVLISLFFMMKIDIGLSTLSLLITFILCGVFYSMAKLNLAYEKSNVSSFGKLYSHSLSIMRNIETIKACGLEDRVINKWQCLYSKKITAQDKSNTLSVFMNVLNNSSDSFSMLAILFLGSIRVAGGYLSVGQLMAYYALHLFFSKNTHALFQALKDVQGAYASHLRIYDIKKYEKETRFFVIHNDNFDKNDDAIVCKEVCFFYNKNSPPALNNINLKIKTGQHVALVGSTGSGKSTLAKLLCALYQPYSGDILLFGKSISEFNSENLARYCAYVSQDTTLFSGTLYENLTLWNENINEKIIDDAIYDACLTDLISERGLHGRVEENGGNFSGGERQRIDLARALVQNTPIMILDESTSALDVATEKKIMHNLRMRNKTIVFVAHRLSTIQCCDYIYMLKQGNLVEEGEHDSLLEKKSDYYNLVQSELYARSIS